MRPKRLPEKVFCFININIIIIVALVTILRPQSRLKKIKNYIIFIVVNYHLSFLFFRIIVPIYDL